MTTAWIVVETIHLFVARMHARWLEPVLDFLRTTRAVRTRSLDGAGAQPLERGIRGNRWFSLIDSLAQRGSRPDCFQMNAGNVWSVRTLELAWEKVKASAGSCGAQKRPLGIPTVQDRVVQTALKMVIEPVFEREFAGPGYGFRPGRGCKDAVRRVESLLKGGWTHVVDVDTKGCLDSIAHDRLLERVKERIAGGRVLGLVEELQKRPRSMAHPLR